jgi:DNA-binding GntR family transcriptional regulator
MQPQTAPPVTKSEYAYAELRRRILDQELPPGARLLLRPLARELGLSVMPVRDAIHKLERDGLVTTESHRGATVTGISRESVLQNISVRMWLEVLAIRDATPRHDAASLAHVNELLEADAAAARTGEGLVYASANRRLHEALEAPAPAPVRALIDKVWDQLWQARRRMSLFQLVPQRIQEAQDEHRKIVAAVRSKDVEAAGAAMAEHRLSTLAAWETALREAPTSGDGDRWVGAEQAR